MITLKNILLDSPLNLYKDYCLGKYVFSSISCSYQNGLIYDQKANNNQNSESCCQSSTNESVRPRAVGSGVVMTISSPFIVLYHLFTSSKELNRLNMENQVRTAACIASEGNRHNRRLRD
jgi:hypothetical protein